VFNHKATKVLQLRTCTSGSTMQAGTQSTAQAFGWWKSMWSKEWTATTTDRAKLPTVGDSESE